MGLFIYYTWDGQFHLCAALFSFAYSFACFFHHRHHSFRPIHFECSLTITPTFFFFFSFFSVFVACAVEHRMHSSYKTTLTLIICSSFILFCCCRFFFIPSVLYRTQENIIFLYDRRMSICVYEREYFLLRNTYAHIVWFLPSFARFAFNLFKDMLPSSTPICISCFHMLLRFCLINFACFI